MRNWLCALSVIGLSLSVARADVKTFAYWRLGDDDKAAVSDKPVEKESKDTAGVHPAVVHGEPKYVVVAASDAIRGTDSKLAIRFDGKKDCLQATAVDPGKDNFGIEAFVKADKNEGFVYIASFGAGSHGFSLIHNNKGYQGLLGGVNLFGWSGDKETGQWAHVALVRQNGKTTFFFNCQPMGDIDAQPNFPPGADNFAIGAAGDAKEGFFTGDIDEVRIFTFEPGKFDPKDFLMNAKAEK